MQDTRRLCVHTITTRPWRLEEALQHYPAAGVAGITLWTDAVADRPPAEVRTQVADAGLSVVSLCRGGGFPSINPARRDAAIDENRRLIALAAELGAPLLVLVCGADPAQPLATSREHIQDAVRRLLPDAKAAGVRLGVEPLHPMYADSRSAIVSLKQANDLCAGLDSPHVGVVLDVYHTWWDPVLEVEIKRAGAAGWIAGFHVSDWRVPTRDMLNDRELMGRGCIPVRRINSWVEQSGYTGFIEVEVFSSHYWQQEQHRYLREIVTAYTQTV